MNPRRYDLDYRRAAGKRFEEAEFLLERGGYATGAIYLAGHAVECMLKAFLVSRYPANRRQTVYNECRVRIGHNLERLMHRLATRNVHVPAALAEDYSQVRTWANELRYDPRDHSRDHASRFLRAAGRIMRWAERSSSW